METTKQLSEEERTCKMLGMLTCMDMSESLPIWNSLTSENDKDLADDHFNMWQPVEYSLTIKQMAEQI